MQAKSKLDVLQNIFQGSAIICTFLGNQAINVIGNKRIAEITLAGSGTSGHYDGLIATIKHKDNGDIASNKFSFEQYLGKTADRSHPNAGMVKNMYIWSDRGKLDWYIVRPTRIDPILDAIYNFIEIYRD